ncbi:MAG TPA: sulfur transferase domain-containing protein [Candidatus Acidoferrales bacterium]|nr:sulfur transferase domain-containing protein [Candidatus Acidoferrales bacterium]
MKSQFLIAAGLIASAWIAAAPARAQEVTSETVDGITNFHRIETTVACAGAIKAQVVPEIKKMGFVSIINLRQASEPGADLEAEAAAAKAADIRYYSVPFNGAAPDPAAADKFLDAITAKGSEPAFIHCAGGGRAATMWFIKRMVVDHWDVERAAKEATSLGAMSPSLKQFAIDYAQTHKR